MHPFPMCGRYRFKPDISELQEVFPELAHAAIKTPRYNVAPTQEAPVVARVTGEIELATMRWGLVPHWARSAKDGAKLINARSETAAEKPSFRTPFRQHRCLVVTHGYYEWQATPHGKQPWHFGLEGDALLGLAGLWDEWLDRTSPGAAPLRTFTILTTGANALARKFHDRMPVILPRERWRQWLSPQLLPCDAQAMLAPFDESAMLAWPVTPRMNNMRYESPDCATPIKLPPEKPPDATQVQMELF